MSTDKKEKNAHPLKGSIKTGYKDNDSSKDRLEGADKEELKKQVQSATDNSKRKVADKIQNSK